MSNQMMLAVAFGAFAGFLSGLVPLIYGIRRKDDTLGAVSLLLCTLSGGVAGFLVAVPVAAVMTTLIATKEKRDE
jgi:hypothetical protein